MSRTMRILVMFDLPVSTKKARRNYAIFRKFLIGDGYDMIQFSVYGRITKNDDDTKKHIAILRQHLPPCGSVRAMTVTEKQYSSMIILVGSVTATENFLSSRDLVEI